jgi:predicted ATPase
LRNAGRYWQFLNFAPQLLGQPRARTRHAVRVNLAEDGSNLGEYLFELGRQAPRILEGIVRTVAGVLGYGQDLQVVQTSELERVVYLTLTERDFKVPGWLLSTGTLRLMALLALLRHPDPPAVLVVEELENGLDPRTVAVILEAIRLAVEDKRTQVIATTHSPHLLNLALLQHIVFVERNDKGEPIFHRPSDNKDVRRWSKRFAPGELYTMNRLHEEESPAPAQDKEAGIWADAANKLIQ